MNSAWTNFPGTVAAGVLDEASVMSLELTNLNLFAGVGASLDDNSTLTAAGPSTLVDTAAPWVVTETFNVLGAGAIETVDRLIALRPREERLIQLKRQLTGQ